MKSLLRKRNKCLKYSKRFAFTDMCPICMGTDGTFITTTCGHTYHRDCIQKWNKQTDTCPVCRQTYEILPQEGQFAPLVFPEGIIDLRLRLHSMTDRQEILHYKNQIDTIIEKLKTTQGVQVGGALKDIQMNLKNKLQS